MVVQLIHFHWVYHLGTQTPPHKLDSILKFHIVCKIGWKIGGGDGWFVIWKCDGVTEVWEINVVQLWGLGRVVGEGEVSWLYEELRLGGVF